MLALHPAFRRCSCVSQQLARRQRTSSSGAVEVPFTSRAVGVECVQLRGNAPWLPCRLSSEHRPPKQLRVHAYSTGTYYIDLHYQYCLHTHTNSVDTEEAPKLPAQVCYDLWVLARHVDILKMVIALQA